MAGRDRFDLLTGSGLLVCILVLGLLLANGQRHDSSAAALDKALEQQMAYQARLDFLHKLYQPVEELRAAGQVSSALLKLDELGRRYPQEAHGEILYGEILGERGALQESIDHYARAVRLNGDYVDKSSPLSRRQAIQRLVDAQLPEFAKRTGQNPESSGLQHTLSGLYYLQSRLAGGCE
jgi:tetratricopeptide (TPR) repeat protein